MKDLRTREFPSAFPQTFFSIINQYIIPEMNFYLVLLFLTYFYQCLSCTGYTMTDTLGTFRKIGGHGDKSIHVIG